MTERETPQQDRAAPRTEALDRTPAIRHLIRVVDRFLDTQDGMTADQLLTLEREIAAVRREAVAPGAAALARIAELEAALQQDANLIHYGRHTKYPEEHSERFEDCAFLRCVARRDLLGARVAETEATGEPG